MVGVPGKSKGCSTCRRRKKGCDQKRPACGQCLSSGYMCGGYQRELSFIVHPASKSAEKAYYVRQSGQKINMAFMPSLDRSAVDLQCRALFWDLYLPHGIAEVHDTMLVRCNNPPNWTSILLELSQDEPALDLAFSALSISRVGRSNNDLRLVKESTKVYGRALKDLQKALTDETRMRTPEVLAACSLLGLYEVFEGGDGMNQSVGWVSHAAGAARLIELRSPHEHITRQPHHVFLGARLPILYSAILRRKKTFLADPQWLTVPWRVMVYKTYHDVLVDLAVSIPGLLEEFDRIRSKSSSRTHLALSTLLDSLMELKEELVKWENGKKQLSRPVTIVHKRGEGDKYPFDREMSWENHLFFNASLVYWSMSLVVSVTISQVQLLLTSLGFAKDDMYILTTTNQRHAYQYATCIAQSVPYALMPDMGALGVNHLAFPLCLAFQHFTQTHDQEVCAWLAQVCNDMRRQGVRLRPFDDPILADYQRDTYYPGNPRDDTPTDAVTGVARSVDEKKDPMQAQWPLPPSSTPNGGSFKTTFIYENPAKYYIDSPDTE